VSSKIKLMPSAHEYDEMFLTINGVYQGNISKGASSAESLGEFYKRWNDNEDSITTYGFNYGAHQGHSNAFIIYKRIDKSSPLLLNAISKYEALPKVELKCYRTAYNGRPEHYYTVSLKNARVVAIEQFSKDETNDLYEYVYFSYHKITQRHEIASTSSTTHWQHSQFLQRQTQILQRNDFNGYNALQDSLNKRRVFLKENPKYGNSYNNMVMFWTVVTLPLGGVALYRTSYAAAWWVYRNPVAVGDFITGFDKKNNWNVLNRYQNAGRLSREIFEMMVK